MIVFCSLFDIARAEYELIILHTNDMHSRFEQTNKFSAKCTPEDAKNGHCYGGFARVAHKVKEIRQKEKNVIFLNAGDTYQGNIWYVLHKWKVVAHFIELIGLDAMVSLHTSILLFLYQICTAIKCKNRESSVLHNVS